MYFTLTQVFQCFIGGNFTNQPFFLLFGFLKPFLGLLGISQNLQSSQQHQFVIGLNNAAKKIMKIFKLIMFSKQKQHFLAQKNVSNFIGQYLTKIDIIVLFYTLFSTYVQKTGGGVFFFFYLRNFYPGFLPVMQLKTRPDKRQSSRGRLGRSSNAKTARNSKM